MDDLDDGFEKLLPECRFAVRAYVWALSSQAGGSDTGSPGLGRNPRWPRGPFRCDRLLFSFRALASASMVDGVPACAALVLRRDALPYGCRTRLQQILDDLGVRTENVVVAGMLGLLINVKTSRPPRIERNGAESNSA